MKKGLHFPLAESAFIIPCTRAPPCGCNMLCSTGDRTSRQNITIISRCQWKSVVIQIYQPPIIEPTHECNSSRSCWPVQQYVVILCLTLKSGCAARLAWHQRHACAQHMDATGLEGVIAVMSDECMCISLDVDSAQVWSSVESSVIMSSVSCLSRHVKPEESVCYSVTWLET